MRELLSKLCIACLTLLWIYIFINIYNTPFMPIFVISFIVIFIAFKAKKEQSELQAKKDQIATYKKNKIRKAGIKRLLFVLNEIVEIKINDLESITYDYDNDLDDEYNDYYDHVLIKVPAANSENERLINSLEPIIIPDKLKPKSRLEYEAMAKDIVPKEVYATAYTSRKCDWFPSNYIAIDTETTGLEPSYQRIIEIGAIKYIDHKPVGKFHMLIDPERNFDDYVVDLTGITKEKLKYKPTIKEALPKFFEFIEDYVLIAHNAPYDIKILACEAYRVKIPLFGNRVIDTLALSKRCIPKGKIDNYKLETIKDYLGLEYKSHRALDDCETCSAIYQLYCSSLDRSAKY